MKYIFNGKEYKKGSRGAGLNSLIFDIFKQYLKDNPNKKYEEIKSLFSNVKHTWGDRIVLDEEDFAQWLNARKEKNPEKRWFDPIEDNDKKLHFVNQWGNDSNGHQNIDKFLDFAKDKLGYDIQKLDTEKNNNSLSAKDNNLSTIYNTKNIILYGVPGVGKTYSHKKLIDLIESKRYSDTDIFKNLENHDKYDSFNKTKEEDRVKFITFHQSFGYEDFIEGFRPNKDGKIELRDGVFKSFCKEAKANKNENYYFIIDEINRGNISKIFGELITLIEEDKRDALHVELPYSKKSFSMPSNIYIIGTMNSTDKSIALIDIALRRRFTFLKMKPNPKLVKDKKARELMEKLNKKIEETLGEDYQIGHSYFMSILNDEQLEFVKNYKIKPLLEEYFYGNEDGYNEILEVMDNE